MCATTANFFKERGIKNELGKNLDGFIWNNNPVGTGYGILGFN